jgi:hypothetical protein
MKGIIHTVKLPCTKIESMFKISSARNLTSFYVCGAAYSTANHIPYSIRS